MYDDASILIVDSNRAFAMMFKEGLEQDGGYRVTVATSGGEALQALVTTRFDMAVVDMGLTDPDGATVARSLRQQQNELRLVLIPLVGEGVPSELADLGIQGALPKPFFLPELPGRISAALAAPMRSPAPPTDGTPVATDVANSDLTSEQPSPPTITNPQVIQEMTALAQEVNAEAVILTVGAELVARTGRLSEEEADELAQAVAASWRTSTRVAQILGREQLRFEQSVEGGEHLFYSLAVAKDVILSVALRAGIPLGLVRHRAKQTVETLRSLMSEELDASE